MAGVIGLLHERLPQLRGMRGLSQNELADLTPGVSLDTVRKYELKSRAGTIPDAEILKALATALGMKPEEAFYEYPIAEARRAARPGVSQRKSKAPKPSETPEQVAIEAAQQREATPPASSPSVKRNGRKGRAA
jgi:transcriptional regulator with XRE-family HTH domain